MAALLNIKFAALCDDVRREDNGKLLFIGIYGRNIVIRRTPANLTLRMAVWVDAPNSLEGKLLFRCFVDDKKVSEGEGELRIDGAGLTIINVGPLVFQTKGSAALSVDLKFEDEEWQKAVTMP